MSGGPYPLATLAPTIDATGISAPTFEDILASLQAHYHGIYGSDTDLSSNSQDGQWIAVQAQAIYDENQAIIASYLARNPASAQGVGLSSIVKINGVTRKTASQSTAEVLIVGTAGLTILNGVVEDTYGHKWDLPARVDILSPNTDVTVTATAELQGDILAPPNTITRIVTRHLGWTSVTNPQAATPGLPVEYDTVLRQRQAVSTSLPAQTPRESIEAALAELPGVGRIRVYQNDSDYYDANQIPPHSICAVIEGGEPNQIAATIALKKNMGCGTFGTETVTVTDSAGTPLTIAYFMLNEYPIYVKVTVQMLGGYRKNYTAGLIANSVAAWVLGLDIGQTVYPVRLWAPAELNSATAASLVLNIPQPELDAIAGTYIVRNILISSDGVTFKSSDVLVPYNSAPYCQKALVQVFEQTHP